MEKQETIEEAAERLSDLQEGTYTVQHKTTYQHGFIDGAKWQQERMYSEEEVDKLLDTLLHNNMCSVAGDELIKQFKKK